MNHWYDSVLGVFSKEDDMVWPTCKNCGNIVGVESTDNYHICVDCGELLRIEPYERIDMICDKGSFFEYNKDLEPVDKLSFEDVKKYKKRIKRAQENTHLKSGVITGQATIEGTPIQIAILDFSFLGGSLGEVEGEKITQSIEKAIEDKTGILIISSSGGARMQESTYSLMQMAKTSAALKRLKNNKLPYISLLTNPTMGGVSASFAFLGDVIIAEPGATIGFAGKRVISGTIRETLSDDFQSAEFNLEHGLIDLIVERKDLKDTLNKFFKLFDKNINYGKDA